MGFVLRLGGQKVRATDFEGEGERVPIVPIPTLDLKRLERHHQFSGIHVDWYRLGREKELTYHLTTTYSTA